MGTKLNAHLKTYRDGLESTLEAAKLRNLADMDEENLRAIIRDGVTALEMVRSAGTFVPPIMVAWLEKAKAVLGG